jgi:ubiquinone/menaquinone biosynthesis C-methylase UbiE
MKDQIEILGVDLLDQERELVESFRRRADQLGISLVWHYLLDLSWIARRLGNPSGRYILDAGAGTGVMQWWLADRGAEVLSVDRQSRRDLSMRFRMAYRVEGLSNTDLTNPYLLAWRRVRDKRLSKRERFLAPIRALGAGVLASVYRKAPGSVILCHDDLGKLEEIPDNMMDAVVSVSALEHNNPNQLGAIVDELMRVIKPGGCLIATLGAARDHDWFHKPSKSWCYTDRTLRQVFRLSDTVQSNYSQYDDLFAGLRTCDELSKNLSPYYFKSGNNGMPWGVWDPKYQSVGILKVKP